MATMIPDACPSKASAGEKKLFRVLRNLLPDNFTAWYEPVVANRYPDFTLLADDFGLLVLEVKGWYAGQVARATDQEVELRLADEGQTRTEVQKNPIRQVRGYAFALLDQLKRQPLLCHVAGAHRGKLVFPVGYGVLLSNITRSQLEESGLAEVLPADRVLCRDELEALEAGDDDRATIARLRQLLSPADFAFDPLTADQVRTVHGVVHKEVVVRVVKATAASVPEGVELPEGSEVLEVLDRRQEQVARALGEGHRVFFGVAGSGKTVLLLARARLLAEQGPDRQVLVLCYNRALSAYLASQLASVAAPSNVAVRTFHSWAGRVTGLRRRRDEPFEAYERRLLAAMLGDGAWPEAERYDAVLIDEAHDFEPDWFRCCVRALRDPESGDLVVAVDGAQSLYGRPRSFTWKSVSINAQGRSRRLAKNYRNTREILDFAWEVAQEPAAVDDEDSETHVRVRPEQALRRGPTPVYRACASIDEEHAVVARLVERFKAEGIADRDIGVLYPHKGGRRVEGLARALEAIGTVCWVNDDRDPKAKREFTGRPGVRLVTIHSAKGLEFPAVILTALDQLPDPRTGDLVADGNLLYVGLTRAMTHLAVTWSGSSTFTERVVQSRQAAPLETC